ncbi:MAG: carboxypeptidase-like regulatory domain-containing protein [Proteobacteria bacterium]|nr:carboxypeptidase-like regulatory domain-containing protein [Pseudomonadota bacterium]
MRYLFFLIFYAFLVQDLYSHEVKGRVVFKENTPVFGANVNIYNENRDTKILSTTTDPEGYFNINLEEGVYFFEATYVEKNRRFVGYSGKNPLLVSGSEYIGIRLLPLYKFKEQKVKNNKTKVIGQVLFEDKPLKDSIVYFYLSGRDIKGMPYVYSMPTNKKGFFEINDILPGKYFIVARKKISGSLFGPIEEGDFIGFFQHNPINLEKGKVYSIVIPVFKKVQDDVPIQVSAKYKITGYAIDEKGNPVSGVYAFAYKNKEMGHERPISISKKTKKDGYFELPIPESGKYYIGVRQFYGGTPLQGELYGLYEQTYDHHIYVDKNIENIKITVRKILR